MKRAIRNTTIADRILFVLLLAASLAGMFMSREAMSQSHDVIVEIDSSPAYTFPLNTDRTFTVNGALWKTVIEIKTGRVRVKEAHCPNQICVREGWVSKGVIVCLPNRVVVFVGGPGRSVKDIDAVTG